MCREVVVVAFTACKWADWCGFEENKTRRRRRPLAILEHYISLLPLITTIMEGAIDFFSLSIPLPKRILAVL